MKNIILVLITNILVTSVGFSYCDVLNTASFWPPDANEYYSLQSTLRSQTSLAIRQLSNKGISTTDLHLDKVLANTDRHVSVSLDTLKRARRELYRNAPNREDERLQPMKRTLERFIEVVETWVLHNNNELLPEFNERLDAMRNACNEFAATKSRASRRQLALIIGWMASRGQLRNEILSLEANILKPNTYIRIKKGLLDRTIPQSALSNSATNPVSATIVTPSGFLGSNQSMQVSGIANTTGTLSYQLVPNDNRAEIRISYDGRTKSLSGGSKGPVATRSQSEGVVHAEASIYWDGTNISFSEVRTSADIRTTGQSFQGTIQPKPFRTPVIGGRIAQLRQNMRQNRADRRNRFVERIAQRKASIPEVQRAVKTQSDAQARENLRTEFSSQLREAFASPALLEQNGDQEQFSKIVAPLVAEDLIPVIEGASTTSDAVVIKSLSRWRHQLGSSSECTDFPEGEVSLCVHESALANTISRSWRAKDVNDSFFVGFTSTLMNEVPYDLYVTETSPRWRVVFEDEQPFRVAIDNTDNIAVSIHIKSFYRKDYGAETWSFVKSPTVYRANYALRFDEYDEVYLARTSGVEIDRRSEHEAFAFIDQRMTSILANDLNFGGLNVPEGGIIGNVNKLKIAGSSVGNEWIKIGYDIPDEVLEAVKEEAQKNNQ